MLGGRNPAKQKKRNQPSQGLRLCLRTTPNGSGPFKPPPVILWSERGAKFADAGAHVAIVDVGAVDLEEVVERLALASGGLEGIG